MLREADLREGAILPIYTDYQSYEGFRGMARLIKEDQSSIGIDGGSTFVKSEKDFRYKNARFFEGQTVFKVHKKKELYFNVLEANPLDIVIRNSEKDITLTVNKPYDDIVEMFEKGDTLRISSDNYTKYWKVVDDSPRKTVLVTYAKYMRPEKNETPIEIEKPFLYIRESQDPQTSIWCTKRWLVEMLPTPFYGRLSLNKEIYYKDLGKHRIRKMENGTIYLESKYDKNKLIPVSLMDLYEDSASGAFRHAKISYFLTTASNFQIKEEVEDDDKDVEIEDFWESPADI